MALRASDIDALLSPAPAQSRPRGLRASDIDALIGAPTLRANASGSAGAVNKKAEAIWGGSFDDWKKRKEADDAERARMVAESEAGNVGSRRAQDFQRKVAALNKEGDQTGDYSADSLRAGRSLEMGMEQGREQIGAGLQFAGETPLALADFFGRIRPKGETEQDRSNPVTEAGKDIRGAAVARQQEIAPLMIDRPESLLSVQGAKYIAQSALQSAPTTGTGLAAAVINPAAGLTLMGAGAGSAKFADARAEDKGYWLSAEAGAAAAAAEVVPEMLPLGFLSGRLLKHLPGTAMKRLASSPAGRGALLSLSEGASEGVTELSNIAYEIAREGKTYTDEQIANRLIDATAVGTVMGGGMAAVAEATGQNARAYDQSGIADLELENSLRDAIKPIKFDPATRIALQAQLAREESARAAQEKTARILGPTASPDAAAGAQIADDAFRAAGVGTVAAADMAEQDALARDLDAATRDQLSSETEIDRLLTGTIGAGDGSLGNGPKGTVRNDNNQGPEGGTVPLGGMPGTGPNVSSNEFAGTDGTTGAVGVDAERGFGAAAPNITTLPDGTIFLPGNPAEIRQRLAAAGSKWQGMAQERDGVPGVRFGRNAWQEVQGVVGGNNVTQSVAGNVPSVTTAGSAALRSPAVFQATGTAGAVAESNTPGGDQQRTQPTQAAVAVDGALFGDNRRGDGAIQSAEGGNAGAGILGPIEGGARAQSGASPGADAGVAQLADPAPPALRDLTDDAAAPADFNALEKSLSEERIAYEDETETEFLNKRKQARDPLKDAVHTAVVASTLDPDSARSVLDVALSNGRLDLAEYAVARAERAVAGMDVTPGVPQSSPKYAGIKANLENRKREATAVLDGLKADLANAKARAEIDRLLTGNAPRERTDLYRASIPGAIPQGVHVSTNQDAFAAPGTIGGRDAPAPIQVTTLPDRSVFVPGDPAAIRQKLADAGSQWQGMAQERDGVAGVRFSPTSWTDVQGLIGGSIAPTANVAPEVAEAPAAAPPLDLTARRTNSDTKFDERVHDLTDFIALNGGLDRSALESEGIDPANWNSRKAKGQNDKFFGKPLFRKTGGMTLETLREKARDAGFRTDKDVLDLIGDSLGGRKTFTPVGSEYQMALADVARQEADAQARQQRVNALPLSVPETDADAYIASRETEFDAPADRDGADLADIESTLASVADTSPQQRASVVSLGHDYTAKLIELKRARAAGALNPEQQEAYIDLLEQDRETGKVGGRPMVGIGNKTAYVDALMQGKLMPVQVFLDADNFKALNDKFGHDVGDDVIRLIADVVRAEFGEGNVFHRGGDEFLTQGMTQEEVDAKMARVQDYLARVKMELPLSDGRTATLTGVGVSYGTGANEKAADDSLKQDKQRRKDAGLRFDRREGDDAGRVGSQSSGAGTEASGANSRDSSRAAAEGVGDERQNRTNLPDAGSSREVAGRRGDAERAPDDLGGSGPRTEAVRGGQAGSREVSGGIATVRSAISQALGAKFLRRLESQPWFHLVGTLADLPANIRKSITDGGNVAGFVLGNDVYIIADQASDPVGVTLHEVGVHFGMSGILGADFAAVLRNFKRQRAKDAAVGRAYERATEAAERGEDGELTADALATLDEEALAYYVEANWNAKDSRGIIAKVIDAIKSMLNRLGIPLSTLNASPEMLRKVAIGAARKAADGRVSVGKGGGLRYHKAWHGTPHDFDKFRWDDSTASTGEGAQAYGYGLYFAGNKDVAAHYRDAYGNKSYFFDGKELPQGYFRQAAKLVADSGTGRALSVMTAKLEETSRLLPDAGPTRAKMLTALQEDLKDVIFWLESITQSDIEVRNSGKLYEVELAPTEDQYLDWDAPLSEQSEKVRAGVRQAIRVGTATVTRGDGERPFSVSIDGNTLHRYKLEADALEYANELNEVSASEARIQRDSESATTGEQAYRAISESKGGDREASRALHAAGIPGIRYLDGSSRGGKTGWRVKFKNGQYSGKVFDTKAEADAAVERGEYNMVDRVEKIDDLSHNFVIFDDSQVEVKAKYSRRADGGSVGKVKTVDVGGFDLPLNPNGTVTLYHHTNEDAAAKIRETGVLRSAGEPTVYVTTEREPTTGYGDAVVAIEVDPRKLSPDDEFPGGRVDFSLDVGRPGGSLRVKIAKDDTRQAPPREGLGASGPRYSRTITVDGTERPTTDSTGKAIHPTEEGVRNFWRWFAGSKITDAKGRPVAVHHGTNATTFIPGTIKAGSASAKADLERMAAAHGIKEWDSVAGIFNRWIDMGMADEQGVTKQVAEHAMELHRQAKSSEESKSRVNLAFDAFNLPDGENELGSHFGTESQATQRGAPFPFYLSITNPIRLSDLGTWNYQSVMRELRKRGVKISEAEYDAVFNARDNNAALRDLMLSKGIDGVVYENEAEGSGDSYIALKREQIKSADKNTGAFSPTDARIAYSRRTAEPEGLPPPVAIESHLSNMLKLRAFWDSAVDVMARQPGLKPLADAVRSYFDNVRRRQGLVNEVLRAPVKAASKADLDAFERYQYALQNNLRADVSEELAGMTDKGRALVSAWEKVAKLTNDENQKVGVQVFDPKIGGWRKIGTARNFFPRVLKPKFQEAMRQPHKYPAEWNQLVRILLDAGRIQSAEDAQEFLNRSFSNESAFEYFAGIEKARMEPLPRDLYDYSMDAAIGYKDAWADRLSQIEAFGQRIGQGDQAKDKFDEVLLTVTDDNTRNYVTRVRERITNTNSKSPFYKFMANMNTLVTGLMLGNPATAALNIIGGLSNNAMIFPIGPNLKAFHELRKLGDGIRDAVAKGVLIDDYMGVSADAAAQGVSERLSNLTQGLLNWGGYNGTEYINRVHSMLVGKHFLSDSLAAINKNPRSRKSLLATAFMQRNGFDVDALAAETMKAADERPETNRFLRFAANLTQGSYKIDQTPIFVDEPIGKFLFKYQKFGTQINRVFYQQMLRPFVQSVFKGGEPVTLKNADGTEAQERVRNFVPLIRFIVGAIPGGMLVQFVREAFFGYGEDGPDEDEIRRKLADGETAAAAAMLAERAFIAITALGAGGFLGNYMQTAKDFQERQRYKNPMDPPGLAPVKSFVNFVMKLNDQGKITMDDVEQEIQNNVSLYRTTKRLLSSGINMVSDESVTFAAREAARREHNHVRYMARRYADSVGIEAKRRAPSEIATTANTPTNRAIKDALLLGDGETARALAAEYVASFDNAYDAANALASIRNSIRLGQPALVQLAPSETERRRFMRWAFSNLTPEGYARIKETDEKYRKAAASSGLWKPESDAAAMKRDRKADESKAQWSESQRNSFLRSKGLKR